ncbi:MAG: pyruvate kinase [Gammaproteobacteria bacterium]|nr:pyruvate kinase [Gammaproteobacteria bacterium]
MTRRTKIVATLGPGTDDPKIMRAILQAGVDVVRINFSHGSAGDHGKRVKAARAAAAELGKSVGVLGDLQGPKIRIDRFRNGPIDLKEGQSFTLDAELGRDDGNEKQVGLTYKDLPQDVSKGDILLLDDGAISLEVMAVEGSAIRCRVQQGGRLSNNKGINRKGGGLSAAALTEKDFEDIVLAAKLDVDYLAVSFPRDADDVEEARRRFEKEGGVGGIVAKIERAEAIDNLENILAVSDAVMVARGDLGVEIGDEELPAVQKQIIHAARESHKVVITATQMMESMITSPVPTRAEVMDVANAMMDGTDAVMLSAETATGKYPVKVVEAMARICVGAEKQRATMTSGHRLNALFKRADEAIAMACMYTANHLPTRAIIALTESGSSALWMSRISSGIPIYAFTRHEKTRSRVTLYRGVYPVTFDVVSVEREDVVDAAAQRLQKAGKVRQGDVIIVTFGDFRGVSGGTNTMKIIRAGDTDLVDIAPEEAQ